MTGRLPAMSIEVLDESGYDLDVTKLAALSRFVMDRMRVHAHHVHHEAAQPGQLAHVELLAGLVEHLDAHQ